MEAKSKTPKIKFFDPLADFQKTETKLSRKDIEAINLELRKGNAEIVKNEYETELETSKIFVDGFVI